MFFDIVPNHQFSVFSPFFHVRVKHVSSGRNRNSTNHMQMNAFLMQFKKILNSIFLNEDCYSTTRRKKTCILEKIGLFRRRLMKVPTARPLQMESGTGSRGRTMGSPQTRILLWSSSLLYSRS